MVWGTLLQEYRFMRTISNILRSRQKIIHRAAAAAQGEASALITPRRKPTQSAKYVTEPANIRVENGYPARLNVTNALKRDTMPLPVHLVEERSVRSCVGCKGMGFIWDAALVPVKKKCNCMGKF
ncbi:uncharacterized protein MCYG_05138 [Microsporum canis CBS 113480]|uniref:Uncharacterized protein n=1 Tax=Arthroderma otae (strain ATCC MYA-4605 / CBS 113480) TaxID=554155 RepID=C5FR16_ARTOC|nr:uncharacterized protein MCYG_05138 [Microsporum canis CBS 113480]EEQ32319.1 predicted protein [Microsporum canis CBS 113480]